MNAVRTLIASRGHGRHGNLGEDDEKPNPIRLIGESSGHAKKAHAPDGRKVLQSNKFKLDLGGPGKL